MILSRLNLHSDRFEQTLSTQKRIFSFEEDAFFEFEGGGREVLVAPI